MNKIILALTLFVGGCSLMPSKWDENQARVITTIRQEVGRFDCKQDPIPQLVVIEKNIEWFNYYAEFKNAGDIEHMMDTLQGTTQEFLNRLASGPVSPTYCQIKKSIMTDQVGIIGSTIKGSL